MPDKSYALSNARRAGLLAICALLTACANPGVQAPTRNNLDAARIPGRGITAVAEVAVSDRPGDQLQLTAIASRKFKVTDLMAVLWCRARQETGARKYDGWYAESLSQSFAGSGGGTQQAVGVIKMFRGRPPEGKQTLAKQKNWCQDVPQAARNA
ncbi:MAG: hypothetical protein SGJ17_11300 [Hyphomicrobiales bacterium]|nr:hypothetical protein [Hyphomicrobiales bacterium]